MLKCSTWILAPSLLSVIACCSSASADPYAVDIHHQLLVDDLLVESSNGLQREVGVAQKHSDVPVLSRTEPWEAARAELYGSIIHNPVEDRFELFYSAMHHPYDARLAVAYSTDTVNWTKPGLEQYDFDGASPTNIVYELPADDPGIQGQYASMGGWVHGPSIIYDEHDADASRRYKMVTNAGNGYMNVLFSPDGVAWTTYAENPVINITSDTGNSVLWDPDREKYVLYGRLRDGAGVREVFRSESSDFLTWSAPQVVYTPTPADRVQSLEYYGHSVTYYEGMYFGLTWMFPNTPDSVNSTSDAPVTWPILTVSRDGIAWNRVSDQPFLPLGAAGTFDHRQIRPASSFITSGDELVFMYSGSPDAHISSHHFDIGQATVPRDRLASLSAGGVEAQLITKPLEFATGRLFVNAAVEEGGFIRVGLVDAAGTPIPGYSADLSQAFTGDSLMQRMVWDGSKLLPASLPEGTRLAFSMKSAKLYSFWVDPLAPKTVIGAANSGFDDTMLGDNQFAFNAEYGGWSEVNPATGQVIQAFNVGPMNLASSDLSAGHDTASNVLYYQQNPTSVRVDQTTEHVISSSDHEYKLSVKVGNDAPTGRFGGYYLCLYADDGETKTILKTLSGNDVQDDTLIEKTLALVDGVDAQFSLYFGQRLGIGLASRGDTYAAPNGQQVPGIVLYDTVKLISIGLPQPDSGDFDNDGDVDGNDFLVWQRDFWKAVYPRTGADATGDGVVDGADLVEWREHLGWALTSVAAAEQVVPEPKSIVDALYASGWLAAMYKNRGLKSSIEANISQ